MYDRLLNGLKKINEVVSWQATGHCHEGGSSCVCGKPIRHCFEIRHRDTGQLEVVGSECINRFSEFDVETFEELKNISEKYEKSRKEAKKALKAKKDQIVIDSLIVQFNESLEKLSPYREKLKAQIFLPRIIWWELVRESHVCPNYKRSCDIIRWHKSSIKRIETVLKDIVEEI